MKHAVSALSVLMITVIIVNTAASVTLQSDSAVTGETTVQIAAKTYAKTAAPAPWARILNSAKHASGAKTAGNTAKYVKSVWKRSDNVSPAEITVVNAALPRDGYVNSVNAAPRLSSLRYVNIADFARNAARKTANITVFQSVFSMMKQSPKI